MRRDDGTPRGAVFIPFAYYEAAANVLTNAALDPVRQDSGVQVLRGGRITRRHAVGHAGLQPRAGGGSLSKALTPAEATQAILSRVVAMPVERLALRQCAGRILRQSVLAERDNPPFDRVCMDGVAIASSAFGTGAAHLRPAGHAGSGRIAAFTGRAA